ncbi:hypothetical protein [Nocardia sp. IFM 10818]
MCATQVVAIRPFTHSLTKATLPAGRPRSYYITHFRRLKAMRLAIALLDTGTRRASRADDTRIRRTAAAIGVREPSEQTCDLVRHLIREGRRGQLT